VDAKRIIIFIVLLIALGFATNRACNKWRKYNPRPGDIQQPVTTPAPGAPTPAAPQPK